MDEPWIALLVVGIFMLVSSVIAILALFLLWRRHQQRRAEFAHPDYALANANRPIPVQVHDRPRHSYETQKMEVFVPQHEGERMQRNLGEVHAHFTPQDGVQDMHRFYPRTNKAYF